MQETMVLLRKIRLCTWIVIVGLVISGATAIPLETEVNWLAQMLGVAQMTSDTAPHAAGQWILTVREAITDINHRYPFLAYGTDWLAFAHFVIAIAFIGALRDPVRNIWLFEFGMIACVLIIPTALIFGGFRGIPFWWRLGDCAFGVGGFIPLFLAWRLTQKLSQVAAGSLS